MRSDKRTDGRADGHDEVNSRFLQFCKSAKKKILIKTLTLCGIKKLRVTLLSKFTAMHQSKKCNQFSVMHLNNKYT